MPDKAPAEFHRRHNHATLTTTGASAAGNGTTILGYAQKGRMRTLQREERKITCRENGEDERTSTMTTAKTTMIGQAGVRLNPPSNLLCTQCRATTGRASRMWRLTTPSLGCRVSAGLKRHLARVTQGPGWQLWQEGIGAQAPAHRRMMNATACATNKNEPKSEELLEPELSAEREEEARG
ncbi:hypothetical protein RAB80_014183 [Fusarium oxysporum f. sp. vasinfectum]|nr:hypothetical protein RAB80_014183 [Fusarium oxysporum f. sp. vasinfectum]